MKNKGIIFWSLLIFAFPFIIYGNSLQNNFLLGDDQNLVLNNIYLKNWKYFYKFFTDNYVAGSGIVSNYWRPFQLIVFSLIFHIAGLKPWVFHLASIFFHGLCGVFMFTLFNKLFRDKSALPIIAFSVLSWLAHPIHNEELSLVLGITSPSPLFWALLGLFSFLNYTTPLENPALKGGDEGGFSIPPLGTPGFSPGGLHLKGKKQYWYLISLFCFVFALLSKESAIIFPGLLLGFHLTCIKMGLLNKMRIKDFIRLHYGFWLIALFYIISRLTFLNFDNTLNFYNQSNLFTQNFMYRAFTLSTVFVHGLKIIFFPVGLNPERSWPIFTSFFSPRVFLSFLVLASIVIIAIKQWKIRPLFSFGIFWFFLNYLPMSNLFAQINALVWDHWFYAPSVGIFLSINSLVLQSKRESWRSLWLILLIFSTITLSRITFLRNPYWKNTESLSRFILIYEPDNVRTWSNLGMSLAERGENKKAIECYLRSIRLSDIFAQTHHNLANIYANLGQYGLAEIEYLRAIQLDSKFHYAYLGLARLYSLEGRSRDADIWFKKALEVYPYLLENRTNSAKGISK